jgi:integrase
MDYKVSTGKDGNREFVSIYFEGKRYRLFNGKSIGLSLKTSENLELLKSAYELKLMEGWRPKKKKSKPEQIIELSFTMRLRIQSQEVQNGRYSHHHKRDCRWVVKEWEKYSALNNLSYTILPQISPGQLEAFVKQSKWSPRTQKNVLTTLRCLVKDEKLNQIKTKRTKSVLHKPIKDVPALLDDIKEFNDALYVCCLLTYGCLLRPHQEIRLLKWEDVDLDRNIISLSGERNKSGRNRIVPLPSYVRTELSSRYTKANKYVLRNSLTPYSRDYIKVLWKRYKQQSTILGDGITLYSLRHTSALHVFQKTGSLQKLQQVMNHSDLTVSLTYLRGLEIQQLDVNDLPTL